jgi:hypothetical protein
MKLNVKMKYWTIAFPKEKNGGLIIGMPCVGHFSF